MINSDTCEKCPHRRDKHGCPCWIGPEAGLMETHVQTGEQRQLTGCFYQVIPKVLCHVVAAANRPAAAMESLRNELVGAIGAAVTGAGIVARLEKLDLDDTVLEIDNAPAPQ